MGLLRDLRVLNPLMYPIGFMVIGVVVVTKMLNIPITSNVEAGMSWWTGFLFGLLSGLFFASALKK